MEIPTPVCALVRNDSVVRCPNFPYNFLFVSFLRETDMHIFYHVPGCRELPRLSGLPRWSGFFFIIAHRQKKASRTGQVFHSWPCDTTFRSCLPAGEWCRAMPGFPPEKKRKKRKMYFYAIFAYTFNFERFLSDYAHFSGNFREIIKKV